MLPLLPPGVHPGAAAVREGDPLSDVVELDTPGDMLLWVRKQAGMTQKQVATEVGVIIAQIVRWEKGHACPNARHFIAACAACGFNVVLEPMTGGGD